MEIASNEATSGERQSVGWSESASAISEQEGKSEKKATGTCPDCDVALNRTEAEPFCEECGYVEDTPNIDTGPEWRVFSDDDTSNVRVGAPTTNSLHDKGLSTTIDWRNRDANGKRLSSKKRTQMKRLRTWDKRYQTSSKKNRNLRAGLSELHRMSSALGLPRDVLEIASAIYRRASTEDLLRGRSIEGIATAALYLAANDAGVPRTYKEFKPVTRVEINRVKRSQLTLVRHLNLEIEPMSPKQYLSQFASKLELRPTHIKEASRLIDEVPDVDITGKGPSGLAAAALYAAGLIVGELTTQQAAADVGGVTPVTIRANYTDFIKADPNLPVSADAIENLSARDVTAAYNCGHQPENPTESESVVK